MYDVCVVHACHVRCMCRAYVIGCMCTTHMCHVGCMCRAYIIGCMCHVGCDVCAMYDVCVVHTS